LEDRRRRARIVIALVAELDPVEHRGRNGQIPMARPPVRHLPYPRIETPDFAKQHHAPARGAGGLGAIGIEGETVGGGEGDACAHDGSPLIESEHNASRSDRSLRYVLKEDMT